MKNFNGSSSSRLLLHSQRNISNNQSQLSIGAFDGVKLTQLDSPKFDKGAKGDGQFDKRKINFQFTASQIDKMS